MAAPTFVAEYEAAWNTSTSPKSVSVTVAVGDLLVVVGAAQNGSLTLSTPTLTGVTWTLREVYDTGSSGFPAAWVWTGTATQAGTFDLEIAATGTGLWGFNCLRFSDAGGIGASEQLYGNPGGTGHGGLPDLDITTTQADSALVAVISDWNAVDGTSRAWLSVAGGAAIEHTYFRSSSAYTVYAARWANAGAAGAKTAGLSAPSGQDAALLVVEVLGTGVSGPAEGAAAVPLTLTVAAAGAARHAGSAAVGVQLAAAATGRADRAGSAAVSLTVTVATSGNAPGIGEADGMAAVSLHLAVAASGAADRAGAADVPLTLTVAAVGNAPGLDPASGATHMGLTFAVAATGETPFWEPPAPPPREQISVQWRAPDGGVYVLTIPGGDVRAQATNALGQAVPVQVTTDPNPRGGSLLRHVQELERYLILPVRVAGTTHQDFVQRWEQIGDAFTQTKYLGPGVLWVQRPDGTAREIEAIYMSGWEGRPDLGWDSDVADALTLLCPRPWWRAVAPTVIRRVFFAEDDFYDPYLTVSPGGLLGETTANNPGQAKAWPLWTITGPLALLTATNIRTGEEFVLDPDWDGGGDLLLGETVTIQTDPVRVRGPAGEIWTGAVAGALWGLDRGMSDVEFAALGAAAGTSIELRFHPLYETA